MTGSSEWAGALARFREGSFSDNWLVRFCMTALATLTLGGDSNDWLFKLGALARFEGRSFSDDWSFLISMTALVMLTKEDILHNQLYS